MLINTTHFQPSYYTSHIDKNQIYVIRVLISVVSVCIDFSGKNILCHNIEIVVTSLKYFLMHA